MKKLSTLLLGLALTASASAQTAFRVHTFPSVMQKAEVKTRPQAHKAPLNEDKQLGKLIYASTQDDYEKSPGVIKFYTGNAYETEKVCTIYEGTDEILRERTTLLGAAWYEDENGDGAYYGYSAINYDLGITYPQYFMKIDLETGEKTNIADFTSVKNGWQIVEDMKQNPIDHKLYAVRQANDGFYSEFGTVDPTNGEFTVLAEMDYWYPSIAYDADGVLYAVRPTMKSQGVDDQGQEVYEIVGSVLATLQYKDGRIDEVDKVSLAKDEQPYKLYYTNTIAVDQETGEIYGALMDCYSWNQTLYTINKETGELSYKGYCYNTMRGFYIPSYKTDSREAAAKVSNVSSEPGDKGQSITLKWTNPTKQVNGNDLTELAEVRIFLESPESLPYAVIPAEGKMGEEMTWTDEDPGEGVRTYFIVPCRKEGEKGYPESWSAWGGPDAPAAPSYVSAERKGTTVEVTWGAPETGSHGGWYNGEGVTYTVTRYPDEKVVATGIAETSYTDSDFPAVNHYTYTVVATNAVGSGEEATSNDVLAGPAHETPYTSVINSYEEGEAWTIIDNNNDGTRFWYSSYAPTGLMLYTNNPGDSDDYAVSPAIKLEGGKTYKVQMTININYPYDEEDHPTNLHDFDFVAGMGSTVDALTNVFYSEREFKNPFYGNLGSNHFTAKFTPETSGEWNVALHWLTKNVFDWITLEEFSIAEVFANDLAISEVEAPEFATANTGIPYYVTVVNEGSATSGNFTVQIVAKNGESETVVGESAENGGLAPGKSTRIYVGAIFTETGDQQAFARIVYDADEEPANNVSAPKGVTVDAEGTVPFSAVFNTDTDLTIDTQSPICTYQTNSTFQSIYYPSDLTATVEDDALTISRLALRYSSNEGGTFTGHHVKVYLNTTDKLRYYSTEWNSKTEVSEWVDFGELCFDGLVSSAEGENKLLTFNLDKEFSYDLSKNLVVTIVKEGEIPENPYPVIFHFYNNEAGGYGETLRSLFYRGKTEFNFDTNNVFGKLYLPILHVAAKEYLVGIDELTFDANSAPTGSIAVYNLSGQLVKAAEGKRVEELGLQSGLYIVRDNAGRAQKIQVK